MMIFRMDLHFSNVILIGTPSIPRSGKKGYKSVKAIDSFQEVSSCRTTGGRTTRAR
jgi:hypothetical protein